MSEKPTDYDKLKYLAGMKPSDIFPEMFSEDTPLSLIQMLAKRVLHLEDRTGMHGV